MAGITTDICFSPGLVTGFWFTSRLDPWTIGGFQKPRKPRERATHASKSEFCLVFGLIIFQATTAENVWPPGSKSARSQVFAALFYVQTVGSCGHGSVQTIRGLIACKEGSAMLS